MKMPFVALLLSFAVCSLAQAQQPITTTDRAATPTANTTAGINGSTLSPSEMTPEMWFYIQEQRRHDDPAQAVRRKAEYKADQRMTRIATAKWYGYSNSRPEASSTPTMGNYSPGWIGNAHNRYDWIAGSPYMAYSI